MTRANVNFITDWNKDKNQKSKIFYFYHNGDQYPRGMRDYFKVEQLLNDFTESGFRKWYKDNYKIDGEDAYPYVIAEVDTPYIYYTGSFITDYSYIFDGVMNKVLVYEWSNKVFEGNLDEFRQWLKEQK